MSSNPRIIPGVVKNGVVVLGGDIHLPEGLEVTVLAPGLSPTAQPHVGAQPHSVLDIAPVSVGQVLRHFTPDDDLLGEMLEGRP